MWINWRGLLFCYKTLERERERWAACALSCQSAPSLPVPVTWQVTGHGAPVLPRDCTANCKEGIHICEKIRMRLNLIVGFLCKREAYSIMFTQRRKDEPAVNVCGPRSLSAWHFFFHFSQLKQVHSVIEWLSFHKHTASISYTDCGSLWKIYKGMKINN